MNREWKFDVNWRCLYFLDVKNGGVPGTGGGDWQFRQRYLPSLYKHVRMTSSGSASRRLTGDGLGVPVGYTGL